MLHHLASFTLSYSVSFGIIIDDLLSIKFLLNMES